MNNNSEKMCSFYVSDVHFITMILPYINRQLKNNLKIVTFFENDLEHIVKEILSKVTIKEETVKKIEKINWNSSNKNQITNKEECIYIIKGSLNYIKEINNTLKDLYNKSIKIINCYNLDETKDIQEILKEHNKVLNTSGEKKIEDVIENYQKKMA